MRHLHRYSIFVILSLFLISCSSSDDDNDTTDIDATQIVGIWNLEDINTENGRASLTQGGVTVDFDFSITSTNEDLEVTFSENPNQVSSEGSYTQITMTNALGFTETDETVIENNDFLSGDWSVNGNTLSFELDESIDIINGFQSDFQIIQLTANSLIIEQELDQTAMLDGDQIQINGTIIVRLNR